MHTIISKRTNRPSNDDRFDCLCSAMAVNCCQFGCFIQTTPRVSCSCENRDWMAKLTSLAPEKKLRDTVIPGTHDSASVTIQKWIPFSAVGLTQNVSVMEQLNRGARYLDIRIGGKINSDFLEDVSIYHGILKGGLFVDIIEAVYDFICVHPGEFIVMEVVLKHGGEMSPRQRLRVFELLASTFGDRIISEKDTRSWFQISKVTLGDLAKQKKNVLLLLHERIYDFSHEGATYDEQAIAKKFGCHRNDNFMKNKWHQTNSTRTILAKNVEFLNNFGHSRDVLLNSQIVMTPAFDGLQDVAGLLSGVKSLRPVSLARKLYRKHVLDSFIRNEAENGWNIVMLDFVDLCPLLMRYLIGLNSPKEMTVEEATAISIRSNDKLDVTINVRNLVRRNCILYLLDFKDDLKLNFHEGELTIKTKSNNEDTKEFIIPFDKDTEYVICDDT